MKKPETVRGLVATRDKKRRVLPVVEQSIDWMVQVPRPAFSPAVGSSYGQSGTNFFAIKRHHRTPAAGNPPFVYGDAIPQIHRQNLAIQTFQAAGPGL